MKVKPNLDRIIVKVHLDEEVTKSGIILPGEAHKERHYEGEVVAVADHKDIKAANINVGDYVWYEKGYNFEFKDGEDNTLYDIVSVFDVLAVKEK